VWTDNTGTYLPTDEGYEYDLNGNRLAVTGGGGTSSYVTGDDNQVLDDGVFEYSYDKEGNRLTKFRKVPTSVYDDYSFYTYDHRNRLVSVAFYDGDDPDTDTLLQQVDYVYDYLDRRTMRVNPLDSSNYAQDRFAYGGLDIILEQHANNSGGFSYTTYANLWVPDGENSLYLSQEYVAGS